jgi:hypothetical protein
VDQIQPQPSPRAWDDRSEAPPPARKSESRAVLLIVLGCVLGGMAVLGLVAFLMFGLFWTTRLQVERAAVEAEMARERADQVLREVQLAQDRAGQAQREAGATRLIGQCVTSQAAAPVGAPMGSAMLVVGAFGAAGSDALAARRELEKADRPERPEGGR